jgi:hypothetical protein
MTGFDFGSCSEETKQKRIVCKEKGRTFTGLNKKGKPILKVEVDGCLKFEGNKCDWLLIDVCEDIAYFVELKGSEVKHALLQLKNTIKIISNPNNNYIKQEFKKKNAYIVIWRSPMHSAKIQKEKIKFRRDFKTILTVKEKIEVKL